MPATRHRDGLKYTRHPFQAAPLCPGIYTLTPQRALTLHEEQRARLPSPWYRQRDLKDSSAGPSPRFWLGTGGNFTSCGTGRPIPWEDLTCVQLLSAAPRIRPHPNPQSNDGAPFHRHNPAPFQPPSPSFGQAVSSAFPPQAQILQGPHSGLPAAPRNQSRTRTSG